jgi:uncharacterized alpha-E superfamily protein
MLNRVADALFWIGRYMERAENHTRLINTVYHLSTQRSKRNDIAHWQHLLRLIGNENDFLNSYSEVNESNVLHYVTLRADNHNSIRSCVHIARNNMRQLREKMPSECWDTLNSLYLWMNEQTVNDINAETPFIFYKKIQDQLNSFQGTLYATMMREREFDFIESGKYLERADNGLRMLQAIHFSLLVEQPKSDYPSMLALLKAVNGYESFRRVYSDRISMQSVVEFSMLHPSFPRSTCYALSVLEKHLRRLVPPKNSSSFLHNKVLSHLGKVRGELLCLDQSQFTKECLGDHLLHLIDNCDLIGIMIDRHFFHEEVVSA